ncbi:FAD-binding oxidoreductase [bacterium]|nr:FAD-binding oxidoreductase [candidate division CSSED10-310 bacterium]
MSDKYYQKVNKAFIRELQRIIETKNVFTIHEDLIDYSHDEYVGKEIQTYPEIVVKPDTTEEITQIIKLCSAHTVPVTVRGSGTGLCGGCVPIHGGVVLTFENMQRIIEIDTNNLTATVEAGVMLMDLYEALQEAGLFFPPHPGDQTATIGGIIATNAGGARAVKYGVVRHFVKGMEVVLPDGEIIDLGGKFIKNSSGYSLMHLMVGSEGTLGIITRATLSLIPPPVAVYTLVAPYQNLDDAIQTVPDILKNKIFPMAVEFIEKEPILISENYIKKSWPCSEGEAHLMVIVDGSSDEEVMKLAESISEICLRHRAMNVFVADTPQKQENILDIRSHTYEAIKNYMLEDLDITVPRSEIANFVQDIHRIEETYGIWLPTYGHAADGNVHIHIMSHRWENGVWHEIQDCHEKVPAVREVLHELGRKYKGTVSGEHGIGVIKKEFLKSYLGPRQIELIRSIKKIFDPNNILNPGKIVDVQ